MLLNYSLGLMLYIVLSLVITVLIFLMFKKKNKKVAGGFVGGFAGLFIAVGLITVNARAYIVTGENEYSYYMVYGTPEYIAGNGATIKVDVPMQNCVIVNDTKDTIVLQKLVYGGAGTRNKYIAQQQTHVIKSTAIDYFFDEITPPKSVSTKTRGKVVKYWLRNLGKIEREILEDRSETE